MTKEEVEKYGTLKAVFMTVSDVLREDEQSEDRKFLVEAFHSFDGQNEYTLKFFPTDQDIIDTFKPKTPSELDDVLDGVAGVPFRSYLECCCCVAWKELNK